MAIDTILVALKPSDDYDSLTDAVTDVAGPTEATVVLGVGHPKDDYKAASEDFGENTTPDELATRSDSIQTFTTRFEKEGIDYEIRGGVGDTGETFVSLADATDADLLYVQGEDRSPTGKALFGDTAQSVLLNAPCPVTFVRR
ncbi:universal stress protein [Natronococcus roseus]|uniref:universal stress protein n=1 Tax=Natronococcus roseus TaxID=1052014 RepID=UPI00374D1A56